MSEKSVTHVQFLLIRHGEAERVASRDELRRLTQRGRDEAASVAGVIKRLQLQPTQVYSSPFIRAQETAGIIADVLGTGAVISMPGITPDDDPRRVLTKLERMVRPGAVPLVVTHMPLIAALIEYLVEGAVQGGAGIATGAGVAVGGDVFVPGLLRVEHVLAPENMNVR